MLAMKRMIKERKAASGCSEIAQPNTSVLIGAMIVEPTGKQINCQLNTLFHVYSHCGPHTTFNCA